MSVSLSNTKDIIATALYLIQNNGTIKNIMDIIGNLEGGLTPEQIQTISDISNALNNDPDFFNTIQTQLNLKRNISDSYTITQTDNLITPKLNIYDFNITNNTLISNINNTFNSKLNNTLSQITVGTIFCKYDCIVHDLQAATIYGGAIIQIQNEINNKIDNYNNTIISPIYSTINSKLNITDYNTTTNNIITNINNTFNTKLNITDFDNFKITNNSELNARQGIFYPIEPLYFSANFDLNRMELILSEEELTTLTNFYNKDYINTLAISNNSSFSTLLNNINSRVLTTDYNLKISDINTTLGTKLNNSEISNYDTTTTINSKLINNAVAWSSGLVNDSYHYINTGSEALVVRNNIAPYDVYMNILNTTGTILAYKNIEVLGNIICKTIYSSLNDHIYINDNLTINGSLSCNSLINYDSSTTITSKLLNYDTTTTINSKLDNKLSLELYPAARSVNLSGVSLFNFKTYVNAMIGWVDILKFETDNAQLNAYTTNTTFINELIVNDGLHIHDYMHLLPTSFLKADNINISCTELSYLDGAASNIQTQLNNKLSLELYPAARSVNLSGVSLFNFKTYVNAMIGWVDILKFETDNAQLNAYTTNTTFINELIVNDGLHIHDYMHLLPTSFLKADNINISCTELSYLDGAASNIQNQLNEKLTVQIIDNQTYYHINGNGAEYIFRSQKYGDFELMKLDVENIFNSNYTTNSVFIERANINTMWLNNKLVVNSGNISISSTELSYLDNVSSNLQTQLDNKLSVEVFPAAKSINLSGNSLFTIKTFKDAMTGYVDVFKIDVIDNYGYGSNGVIIGQNLGIVGDLIVMEHAQLQSTTNIYTSSNLNQNYITSGELYNMKSSTSNIQTQINSRISSATLTSTLSTYDTISSVNTKIEGTKPWVSGRLFAAGTISNNAGAQNALIAGNINNSSAGTYVFTIPAHPNGANYNIFLTASPSGGGAFLLTSNVNSSTSFTVYIYNTSGTLTNTGFNFMSVP